jgi:hypothetical protein
MKNHLLIHRVSRILVLTAAGAAFLAAQQGRLAGPLAGYVFDRQSQALRPILGIPGASTMGDPINIGFAVADAYVAPRQDAAVVVSTDGSLHIFRLDAGVATEHQVAGLAGTPQRVAFSPSGTAAALYAAGQLQVILGLPGAPALAATFPITLAGAAASSGGPGQPHPRGTPAASLAISDDGAYLLTVSSGEVRLTATGAGSWSPWRRRVPMPWWHLLPVDTTQRKWIRAARAWRCGLAWAEIRSRVRWLLPTNPSPPPWGWLFPRMRRHYLSPTPATSRWLNSM